MALRELKVCLLGDTGVGKSSIVWRFVEDSFDPNINPTIGASFMTKTVQYQNELHKFLIWDTAGQERFRALAPMYYRGSAAAIIVYDITKEETFSTLKNWVKELRQHGPPNIVVAIAGNKCDLNDVREVIEKDAKDYADSIHAIFVETSAKNAININELFIEISRRIPSTDTNPPSIGESVRFCTSASRSANRTFYQDIFPFPGDKAHCRPLTSSKVPSPGLRRFTSTLLIPPASFLPPDAPPPHLRATIAQRTSNRRSACVPRARARATLRANLPSPDEREGGFKAPPGGKRQLAVPFCPPPTPNPGPPVLQRPPRLLLLLARVGSVSLRAGRAPAHSLAVPQPSAGSAVRRPRLFSPACLVRRTRRCLGFFLFFEDVLGVCSAFRPAPLGASTDAEEEEEEEEAREPTWRKLSRSCAWSRSTSSNSKVRDGLRLGSAFLPLPAAGLEPLGAAGGSGGALCRSCSAWKGSAPAAAIFRGPPRRARWGKTPFAWRAGRVVSCVLPSKSPARPSFGRSAGGRGTRGLVGVFASSGLGVAWDG
ncbi:ras-related protein Rab-22A [Crotalus adamanteus]|uniref:Ras-related protein Rab-22A n=3 Tax=Sauria TaxID=32561 RepID=A0AAW1BS77_CROAD